MHIVLTATTPLFDLVSETQLTGTPDAPLQVPPGAVVVPGVRALDSEFARAETKVILATVSGEVLETTVGELLPGAFRPDDMDRV